MSRKRKKTYEVEGTYTPPDEPAPPEVFTSPLTPPDVPKPCRLVNGWVSNRFLCEECTFCSHSILTGSSEDHAHGSL